MLTCALASALFLTNGSVDSYMPLIAGAGDKSTLTTQTSPVAQVEASDYRRFPPPFRVPFAGCCAAAISTPLRPSSLGVMLSSIHF